MMHGPADHDFTLVCPFLEDDPLYARGVEFGMLYQRMQRARDIRDYFTTANQEQITLLANRLGWTIIKMETWNESPEDWFYLEMRAPKKDGDS